MTLATRAAITRHIVSRAMSGYSYCFGRTHTDDCLRSAKAEAEDGRYGGTMASVSPGPVENMQVDLRLAADAQPRAQRFGDEGQHVRRLEASR